jgi:hypothetical protein
MSFYPPFQPRLPLPMRRSHSRAQKSLRRISIFPNYRPNLPTSNTSCARFRLWRKDFTTRERQLAELKALEEETYRQIDDAHKTAGLQRAVFVLRAEVHKISVALEQITQDPRPELLTLTVREPAAKSLPDFPPIDLRVHARYIACNSNTTYLELESRPSTPFSLSLTPSLAPSTAPSSRPTTPPLMVEISTHFPIDETATLYHGQIEDVTNSCYHGGWCHRALHNSLKTRRPGGRLRIRRRKTKHLLFNPYSPSIMI